MTTTIQELEKINPEIYKENPQELVKISKQLLNLKKFEKGIEIAEKAITYTIAKHDNDESNIECAKFYYHYADALIRKCMESDDLLAMNMDGNENKDSTPNVNEINGVIQEDKNEDKEDEDINPIEDNNVESTNTNNLQKSNIEDILEKQVHNSSNINHNTSLNLNLNTNSNLNANSLQQNNQEEDGPEICDENENEEKSDANNNETDNLPQDDSDEQVALENLIFAEKIYKTYLEKYDNEDPQKLKENSPDIIRLYLDLSNVYQKFGDLEMCKSDFKSAIEFFNKSLEVRQKYDHKFSRAIAEIYFNMATAYDFDPRKCLLSYYKTKIIMEYHLKEELGKIGQVILAAKVIINDDGLASEFISPTDEKLKSNRDVTQGNELNNEELLKHDDIEELVAIIAELNQKIDDVVIDINQMDLYNKEKEVMSEDQNKFTMNYDESKVVDINTTGLIRKRQRKDENQDVNEKEEGGKIGKNEENLNNNNN
jgi:hypothetical protein